MTNTEAKRKMTLPQASQEKVNPLAGRSGRSCLISLRGFWQKKEILRYFGVKG